MINPHEEQQTALISRIIGSVEKLNEAFSEVNRVLRNVNEKAVTAELASQMWMNYSRSVGFNMIEQKTVQKPV